MIQMPNWRRIIIGDAFKLPSRDYNYYRDFTLVWPFVFFSIVSLIIGFRHPRSPADTLHFHRVLVVASPCLLLAKEKLLLAGIASVVLIAFLFRGFLLAAVWERQWQLLLGILLCLSVVAGTALAKAHDGWRISYDIPEGITIVQLLMATASVLFTLGLAEWMQEGLRI